ncbi:MAG TPA: hypothetical protein VIJ39_06795 [Solirubrobacteraceae bacterium]
MRSRRFVAGACLWACVSACAVLVLGAAPALAARNHAAAGSFGKAGSGAGEFNAPAGVAVNDSTGDVYVVDRGNNRVEYFTSTGSFVGQFDGSTAPTGGLSSPEVIAVDNSTDPLDPSAGDVYVTDTGHKVIDKFSSTGTYIGQVTETTGGAILGELDGVATDSNGLVWVYQASGEIDSYNDALANEFQSARSSPFSASPGFAVDSEDNLYVNRGGKVVAKISSGGSELLGEVDGEETTAAAVNLSTNDVYLDNLTTIGRFTAAGSPVERFGSGDLNSGSGIGVNSSNDSVYAADSAADRVEVFVSEPAKAPVVVGESMAKVTGDSATLLAEINAYGGNTEYHFEYGECASISACTTSGYGQSLPLPAASIGSAFAVEDVSVHLQGLLSGAVYHFRVIAHSGLGTVDGEEQTFTTQSAGVLALPDGRAWEMVSPPQKEGALFGAISEGIIQASANGDAFTDMASEPTEENAAGNYGYAEAVFFARSPEGWSSKVIVPPHSSAGPPPVGNGQEYRIFSEDLSKGILQPFGPATPLVPEVTESTPYIRTNYKSGNSGELCGSDCFQPLVTVANVLAGTKYGGEPSGKCENDFCGPQVVGASPDLSHVVLSSPALTSGPPERFGGLYDWSGGKLQFLSLLPPGETNEDGGPEAAAAELGRLDGGDARHAISDDGSRIIWSGRARAGGSELNVYASDSRTGETIRLDVPQASGLPEVPEVKATFEDASADGSKVFFTSTEPLTEGADESALYEYDFDAPAGRRLTDLAIDENPGEQAGVSMVTGASEDGSYVYFTANGALASGAQSGHCGLNDPNVKQLCNLYVHHDGLTKFIAGLSQEDESDWDDNLTKLPARVSSNGRWLAFMSNRDLIGYDTTDAISGRADEEVYLYDASTGKLTCASCDPTGARPVGVGPGLSRLVDSAENGDWIAANVPGWTPMALSKTRYQSRYLADSGRLFFDSNDALVPQDVNGTQDVYEYEPSGVGSCTSSSAMFSERSGGCVAPLSSGTSNEESAFLDASEDGSNVFFLTSSKLLPQDFDNALDVYDARECVATSPCISAPPPTPPQCDTGDSCKPSPSPQPAIFGSPSSATFSGAGNVAASGAAPAVRPKALTRTQKLTRALKLCLKKKGKQRAVCERKARSQYSVKRSRKVNATKKGKG